jgi:hypothetical protein
LQLRGVIARASLENTKHESRSLDAEETGCVFWSEIQIPRFLRHSDFVIQSLKSSSSFEEKLEAVQATCDTKSRR